jgi:hypothetical protein
MTENVVSRIRFIYSPHKIVFNCNLHCLSQGPYSIAERITFLTMVNLFMLVLSFHHRYVTDGRIFGSHYDDFDTF